MPQFRIETSRDKLIVHSWTTGSVESQLPKRPLTEADILAKCLWLERRGFLDEADQLLQESCDICGSPPG